MDALNFENAIDPLRDDEAENLSVQKNAKSSTCSTGRAFSGAPDDRSSTGQQESSTGSDDLKSNSTDIDGEKDNQVAQRLALSLGGVLCFDDMSSEWYHQTNNLWRPISKRRAQKIIMKRLGDELPDGYAISKLNALEQFLSLILLLDDWTKDRNLLPLKNGVLNIKSRELRPYQRSDRFNWQLPYIYDPEAKIQVIADWLRDATGNDPEQIKVIRAFAKVAVAGGDLQKFLEVIGRAGSGKSTLVRLLMAAVGKENTVITDLKNLEGRFETANLYGKRLAIINDSTRYGGEVSVLKAITGGDTVRYEKKSVQAGQGFVFEGVVIIVSNEPVQTADYTSGMIRRRMPVTFNNQVTDADKAKWKPHGGIESVMIQELSGFLNWVLDISDSEVRLAIGGLNGEMTPIQRKHLIETNKLAHWLNDNCVALSGNFVGVGRSVSKERDQDVKATAITEKLYSNYEDWCEGQSVKPIACNTFSERLIDVCKQVKLDVSKAPRTEKGVSIIGLAIRNSLHSKFATPITNEFINVEPCSSHVEPMSNQTRANTEHVELSIKTQPEINPDNQAEVF